MTFVDPENCGFFQCFDCQYLKKLICGRISVKVSRYMIVFRTRKTGLIFVGMIRIIIQILNTD